MDADARELFERSIRDATSKHSGRALDDALAGLGWHDALADEPRDAVGLLFERQGAANATSTALDAVVLRALGVTADGVVLPTLGGCEAPAVREGDHAVVDGMALAAHDRVLVVAHDVATVVPLATLEVRSVRGIDPGLGLLEVRGTVEMTEGAPVDWTAAVVRAQRAIAHELIGASRKMLELACAHALEREQFGRPIATFQAVRHRLADVLIAIETADAAVDASWLDESPFTAATAKALAGRGARVASRHCQQVLAGIGFTTEHDLHRYIRRVLVLDQLFGSSKALTKEWGEQLLSSRQLPALLPL